MDHTRALRASARALLPPDRASSGAPISRDPKFDDG